MAVESWPDGLSHGRIQYKLAGGGRTGGAFPGQAPATGASTGGPHWTASLDQLWLTTAAEILAGRALEARFEGGAAGILLPLCPAVELTPQLPGGAPIAASLVGAADSGATEITIALTGDYLPIVGGEFFSADHDDANAGRRLYSIGEVTDAPGGGVYTVRIQPGLRDDTPAGAALDFLTPSCPMALSGGFDLDVALDLEARVEATFTEWFERAPANQPHVDVPPPEPGPDLIIGIRFRALHTFDGDVYFQPAQFGFLDDWAGDDIDGTPISSTTQDARPIGNARDGDGSTSVLLSATGWCGLTFPAPIPVPHEGYLMAPNPELERMPSDLVVEVTSDETVYSNPAAATWTVYRTYTGNPTFVRDISTAGTTETRYYAILDETDPDIGPGWDTDLLFRRQRVHPSAVAASNIFGLGELRLNYVAGVDSTAPGVYRGWSAPLFVVSRLFDGNPVLDYSVGYVPDAFIECDSGKVPQAKITELMMQASYFAPHQAPTTFTFEGSNWEGRVTVLSTHSRGAWSSLEVGRFLV